MDFITDHKINSEIVSSARVFGQWLNRTAATFADREIESTAEDRKEKIREIKTKILKQIETDVINAATPQDMLYRTSMRAVRMSRRDVPAKAARFIDAVNSGEEIKFDEAKQMIMMYMRLKPEQPDSEPMI